MFTPHNSVHTHYHYLSVLLFEILKFFIAVNLARTEFTCVRHVVLSFDENKGLPIFRDVTRALLSTWKMANGGNVCHLLLFIFWKNVANVYVIRLLQAHSANTRAKSNSFGIADARAR